MQKRIALFTLFTMIFAMLATAQQDKSKRPSPPAKAQCQFTDGKTIKVDYSSPRTHDPKTHEPRKIYGGLVPYGQVWRTGANDATSLVTDTNLTVGGKDVPAGSGNFVQAGYACRVRGVQDQLRFFFDLLGDRAHGLDEQVHFLFRFALGRLDHQRSGDNQRKRRGVGMEAVID